MKVGILFDLDGTLLETLQDLTDSVNYALRQHGCPERSLEQVRQAVGNGTRRLIAESLPGAETDPPVDAVLETYLGWYAGHCQVKTRPYGGIPEALEQLRGKYPVGIVSNKPDKTVKLLCREHFGDVYALGELADCPRKPAPDMAQRAMAQLGVDRCVYVGDTEVDVLTAQNAGVPCLCVLWGFRDREQIEAAGGRLFCDDPKKLPEMLTGMLEDLAAEN